MRLGRHIRVAHEPNARNLGAEARLTRAKASRAEKLERVTERAEAGRRIRRARRRWRARGAGNPPCAQKRPSIADRARLRGAIWRGRRSAPRYRAAAGRLNGRARTSRRKRRPPAADTRDPAAYRRARIAAASPSRKMQFTKKCFHAK